MRRLVTILPAALALLACAGGETRPARPRITISASTLGAEAQLLRRQVARFQARHPELEVVEWPTPDAADERHQLYVQWLNAGAGTPDVLQLDVIWTAELAAAGWLRPLDALVPDPDAFFPATLAANRWRGHLYALPWFVDVGLLYYRTDLVPRPPATYAELVHDAAAARRAGVPYGLVWQGARYEGLVTTFVEYLGATGGRILDADGEVRVAEPAAVRALELMRQAVATKGLVPTAALTWREEQVRFAFQNGQAVFMRNWPYCVPLLADPRRSRVAGRVGVAPFPPAAGGAPTAALGGAQLAVNAASRHPAAAAALVAFLTAPEQLRERALVLGQLPPRPALYDESLRPALGVDPQLLRGIVGHATPRPVTPVYTQLSEALQAHLHRALTDQERPATALAAAAAELRTILRAAPPPGAPAAPPPPRPRAIPWLLVGLVAVLLAAAVAARRRARRRRGPPPPGRERRLVAALVAPALLCLTAVALVPLLWNVWESLHRHDLRLPWLGRPFVGVAHYAALLHDGRFGAALGHTLFFVATTVSLELLVGTALALALHRAGRGRGLLRAAVLLPWALPTVVAALIWRFLFDGQAGLVNAVLVSSGAVREPVVWFARAATAWVPVILADVWKTTPFVTLLVLAARQGVPEELYEAARLDGAGPLAQLRHVTLPQLRPALAVALVFRSLDALRVFDLVYVLTGGGPGTATEPLALYAYSALLQHLRFGYGAALSVVIFLLAVVLALLYLRTVGAELAEADQ